MLKLTVKAGEYLLVGDNVKVVFTGGSANNLHVLVDAPRSMNIVRSTALEKYGMAADPGNEVKHHRDRELSSEAKEKIKAILMEERKKAKREEAARNNPLRKYGGWGLDIERIFIIRGMGIEEKKVMEEFEI